MSSRGAHPDVLPDPRLHPRTRRPEAAYLGFHVVGLDVEMELLGVVHAELEVYGSNRPAVRLYERFDFTREGIKRSPRSLDGQTEDIPCMALLLPPLGDGAA